MAGTPGGTELHRVLGRLEGKMDSMISVVGSLHSDHKELSEKQGDLERQVAGLSSSKEATDAVEARVAALEQRVWRWGGGLAVILPIIMAAIAAAFKSFGA